MISLMAVLMGVMLRTAIFSVFLLPVFSKFLGTLHFLPSTFLAMT